MEHSFFYNALPDPTSPTGYDRNYNGDDISNFFAIIWETGVVKSDTVNNEPQGNKIVTANDGLKVRQNIGWAAINGKGYYNDSIKTFTLNAAPTGSSPRYDYIVIRFNRNIGVRFTQSYLVTGTNEIPNVTDLTRNNDIYEIMLCYIQVDPNATTITQSKITDTRGDQTLCPWFTAVKGYEDYYDAILQSYESVVTMASAGTIVTSTIASTLYNNRYSLIEVYTNGIREARSNYSVQTSGEYIQITFTTQRVAGSKITIDLDNFIDGEGLSTAISSYNAWVNDVADLKEKNEFNYICNGVNDNVIISNIVKTFQNGGTDYGSMKLNIIGEFGEAAMAAGGGTSSNPYKFFDFATDSPTRKVILDFTNCSFITVVIPSGSYNVLINTNHIHIIGLNISANQTAVNTIIRVFNTSNGQIQCDNCRFWLTGYQDSIISMVGTFNNCRGSVANLVNNTYCFLTGASGILRIYNGEYYAYTSSSSARSAIVGQSSATALAVLYAVNGPTLSRSGFYQTDAILQYGGWVNCTDLITNLRLTVIAGSSNIRGTTAMNKPNQL